MVAVSPPSCAQVLRMRSDETMESSAISPAFIIASRASLARLSASGRKVWGVPHRDFSLVGISKSNRTYSDPSAWPRSCLAEWAARRTASVHLLALGSAVDTTRPRQSLGLGCGLGVPLAWNTIMAQGYRTERTLQGSRVGYGLASDIGLTRRRPASPEAKGQSPRMDYIS